MNNFFFNNSILMKRVIIALISTPVAISIANSWIHLGCCQTFWSCIISTVASSILTLFIAFPFLLTYARLTKRPVTTISSNVLGLIGFISFLLLLWLYASYIKREMSYHRRLDELNELDELD